MSETLTECRRQLTRVVAVLQEVAAAGAQMVAPLAEQEGLSALKLEDTACGVVEQVGNPNETRNVERISSRCESAGSPCRCTAVTASAAPTACVSPAAPSSRP